MPLLLSLAASPAFCQTNYADAPFANKGEFASTKALDVEGPARSYLAFFTEVKDSGSKPISSDARAAIRLDNRELRAVLAITADLATESRKFGERAKALVFESRMQFTEANTVSPALQGEIRSLTKEWEAVILEHVGRLNRALEQRSFQDLDRFVRTGKSMFGVSADGVSAR